MPTMPRMSLAWARDVAVAGALCAAGVLEVTVPLASRQGAGSVPWSVAVVCGTCVTLVFRRRYPLPVAVLVLAGLPLCGALGPLYVLFYGQLLPVCLAVFTVGRHGRGRAPLVGGVLTVAVLVVLGALVPQLSDPGDVAFDWGVLILVWGAALGLRGHAHRAEVNHRRAVEAEVGAAEQAMAAALEERTRIARELHDVIAHSVSLMVVQAGAAEQAVDDPELTRRALATIRTTGAGALAEMRRVVTVLRSDEAPQPLAPQPGLDGVAGLVQEARAAGLDASLAVSGGRRPLPPGLDLVAYRVVQEALSNVRRHAVATRAAVSVDHGRDQLRIQVSDDGVGIGDRPAGHGLIGMRERVLLYGGQLQIDDGAGCTVHVVLPIPAP